MKIDSHQHFWNYTDHADDYVWMSDEYGALRRDLLRESNIRNFNIFLHRLPDGKLYEFGYYEYVGTDHASDMAKLDAHPRHAEWLRLCDPMQIPLPDEKSWSMMERVYFNP